LYLNYPRGNLSTRIGTVLVGGTIVPPSGSKTVVLGPNYNWARNYSFGRRRNNCVAAMSPRHEVSGDDLAAPHLVPPKVGIKFQFDGGF